jgi:hypothetical protein
MSIGKEFIHSKESNVALVVLGAAAKSKKKRKKFVSQNRERRISRSEKSEHANSRS